MPPEEHLRIAFVLTLAAGAAGYALGRSGAPQTEAPLTQCLPSSQASTGPALPPNRPPALGGAPAALPPLETFEVEFIDSEESEAPPSAPEGQDVDSSKAQDHEHVSAPKPRPPSSARRWRELKPANAPSPRQNHKMVYDSKRKRIVLFGGWTGTTRLNDAHVWNGHSWSPLPTTGTPSPRSAFAMAYDKMRDVIVLTGGRVGTHETWELRDSVWSLRETKHQHDIISANPAMAYDERGRVMVLWGNSEEGPRTWEYNGQDWSRSVYFPSPQTSSSSNMVYDRKKQKIFLLEAGSAPRTWTYRNGVWSRLAMKRRLSRRYASAMVFDGLTDAPILFSGKGPWSRGTFIFRDTWWRLKKRDDSPPKRHHSAMAYDEARQRIVLFGGNKGGKPSKFWGDTWVY